MRLVQLVLITTIVLPMPGGDSAAKAKFGGERLGAQEQRIEIVIRDSDFLLTQPPAVQLGVPTVIILRNEDIVRHGFTSPMLGSLLVTAESEGMTAYGKGMTGFYVNPDKTLVIRFTPERAGQYGFRCDLHPQMKGEVFLLELGQA